MMHPSAAHLPSFPLSPPLPVSLSLFGYSILSLPQSEENSVAEAASPYNENVGFISCNALAGGVLTGKYSTVPTVVNNSDRALAEANLRSPRGRMDNRGWGQTLYWYQTYAALCRRRSSTRILRRPTACLSRK